MLKMRWVLLFGLLAVLCLSTVSAEDPKSEPESEPEAEAEPKADEDAKQAGSSVAGKQRAAGGNNPASAPWAFSVPAIVALALVAKVVL